MCKRRLPMSDDVKDALIDIGTITVDEISKCFWEDVPFIVEIGKNLISLPHLIQQELFWNKFYKYIMGIKQDPNFEVKFAKKIATTKDRNEFSRRIISIIDKIEETRKIDYIINATRALCWNQITRSEFFRICHVIEKVYIDDLIFILENYNPEKYFAEDITVTELTSFGLMWQEIYCGGSIGSNEVPKTHVFTDFGKLVYDNALNYERIKSL